jgi:PAS domain S-box-containing protein
VTGFYRKFPVLAAYGFAVTAVAITLILSLLLAKVVEPYPFLLLFVAITLSAWVGGFGPGFLASVLSILAVNQLFLYPAQTPNVEMIDLTRIAVFILSVTLLSLIRRRQQRTMAALRQSYDQLSIYLREMANGVIVQDKKGKLVYSNYEAAKLMGFVSAEALMGAPMDQVLAKFDLLDEFGDPFPYGSLPARLALLGMRYPEAILRYRFKDGGKDRWSYVKARPLFDAKGEAQSAISLFLDITELKETQQALTEQREQLNARVRQQETVANLGLLALSGIELTALMQKSVEQITQTLDFPYAKVLELQPDGQSLLLRAGVGWKEGLVGSAMVDTGKNSQAGYTLLSNEPVIVEDLTAETRFNGPSLLREHGVVSGMSVIIAGDHGPWGVLGAHTREKRIFTKDDVHFLQAIANLLASSISRERIERAEREQRIFAEALRDTAEALSNSLDLGQVLDCILENTGRVIAHDAADIMLVNGDTARVARYRGYDEIKIKESIPQLEFSVERTPTLKEMATTGHPLLVPNTSSYSGWLKIPEMEWLRSYISFPLIINGKVKGFLNLSSVTADFFTAQSVVRLQPFATQATIAIHNAQLYSEARGTAES